MEAYRKIICAIDLSEYSGEVLARAMDQSRRQDSQLTLLHIIENFPEDRTNEMIAPEDIDPVEYEKEQTLVSLSGLAAQYDCGEADLVVLFSSQSAGREIVHYAGEHKADLIVVGSHGHNGLASLLGSTANRVVQTAPGDVLAVRIDDHR